MDALMFTAGPGENWARIGRLSGVSTHETVEQHLAARGVRLSSPQGVSGGTVHRELGINFDRVVGASQRYYDLNNPGSSFLSVLVID